MLEIYPISDNDKLDSLFELNKLDKKAGAAGYSALDGGKEVGYCLFCVNQPEKLTEIYLFEPTNGMLLCDSLVRSVINYSANRGVFKLFCFTENSRSVASKLTYPKGDTSEIDIADMMHGCKNCKKV